MASFRLFGKTYEKNSLNWIQRIISGLNNFGDMVNEAMPDAIKKATGSGLTAAEQEMNEFNASEARAADERAFQYDMRHFQEDPAAQVAGYKAAGLNPALMYGSGVNFASGQGTAAQGQPMSSGEDIIPLMMQLARMPFEMKMMQAEVADKEEDVKRKQRENRIGDITEQDAIDMIKLGKEELINKIEGIKKDNLNKEDQHAINLLEIVRKRLDNEQFEQLMPLVVEHQRLENSILTVQDEKERERIESEIRANNARAQEAISHADWLDEDKKYLGRYNMNQVGGTFLMALGRAMGILNESNQPTGEFTGEDSSSKAFKSFKPFGFLYGHPLGY